MSTLFHQMFCKIPLVMESSIVIRRVRLDMIEDTEEIMAAVKDSAGLVMEPENKAALERVEQEIIDLQNVVLELHKAKQQRSVTATD